MGGSGNTETLSEFLCPAFPLHHLVCSSSYYCPDLTLHPAYYLVHSRPYSCLALKIEFSNEEEAMKQTIGHHLNTAETGQLESVVLEMTANTKEHIPNGALSVP